MEQSGKNRALKTQWQRESVLLINLHTCLANKASLKFSISLNPDKCNFYMIFIILLFIKIVSFPLFLLI